MLKKTAQNIHTKRRALQRSGLTLNKTDLRQIVQCIQEHRDNVSFVKAKSNRVSIWNINYKGVTVNVPYDKKRKTLASWFPEYFTV